MRNSLIAAVISLSTLAFSQPVKADSNLLYTSAYKLISTSENDYFKNREFRAYTLKWLGQDKGYPHKVAILFCDSKRLGWSTSQIVEISYDQLVQRKNLEGWSESRFDAYRRIVVAGMSVGKEHYCPEFLGN